MGLKDAPYNLATLTGLNIFSVLGLTLFVGVWHLLKLFEGEFSAWLGYWMMVIMFLSSCSNYAALWSLVIRGPEDVVSALTNLGIFLMSFM